MRSSFMKKFLMSLAIASVFVSFAFAEAQTRTKNEKKWTSMSYVNVPIVKILEAKDGYVVIYQKNKTGVGNVVIPKKWIKGSEKEPRKLKLRNIQGVSGAYMTVIKDDNKFKRVVLSIPMDKSKRIWGVVDSGKQLEGTDKDALEELEL